MTGDGVSAGEGPRLPPFPDELLEASKKARVIAWLRSLELPPWVASHHLGRWAAHLGVELAREDYHQLRTRGVLPGRR